MKHGTYSEALKAGFGPTQAGFLARMCIDTQGEIRAEFTKKQEEKEGEDHVCNVLNGASIFAAGMAVAYLISIIF